jgi:hypothetical protein
VRLPAQRAVIIVVGAAHQHDERTDDAGQHRAQPDGQPEAQPFATALIVVIQIPLEHADLLSNKRSGAKR